MAGCAAVVAAVADHAGLGHSALGTITSFLLRQEDHPVQAGVLKVWLVIRSWRQLNIVTWQEGPGVPEAAWIF